MAGIKLCTIKKADQPYFIRPAAVRVYTAEELAFFLWQNPWLIDGSILNTSLTRWIAEELDMSDTALTMESAMRHDKTEAEILRPFYEEVAYLTRAEWKHFAGTLDRKAQESRWGLLKRKGDALARNKRLMAAQTCYHDALDSLPADPTGSMNAFRAEVWHNLGVLHVKMLDGEEGIHAFRKAFSFDQNSDRKKTLMLAMRLFLPREKYDLSVAELEPTGEELAAIEAAYDTPVDAGGLPADPVAEVHRLARTYHSETGS